MSFNYPKPRATLDIGDCDTFAKTITEADIFKFADVTGDYNPLHLDEAYARKTEYGRCVAHNIITASIISTVLSQKIPGLGTNFSQLEIMFLKPVYINDTITAKAMVEEIIDHRRVRMLVACVNQDGEDVAIGNAVVVAPEETVIMPPPTRIMEQEKGRPIVRADNDKSMPSLADPDQAIPEIKYEIELRCDDSLSAKPTPQRES